MWHVPKLGARHGLIHRLDPAKIISTAENISQRISRNLPGSTLEGLAAELVGIARETDQRILQAKKPILSIRFASLTAIGLCLLGLSYLLRQAHTSWKIGSLNDLVGVIDTGFNLVILISGALWFLITLEARLKRRKALESIQELREFIHVIDVTQLYHTPEMFHAIVANRSAPWTIDHTYLIFCTEMFGVISNLAALYARGESADSILRAAFDVEMLANTVSSKLLSKVELVRVSPTTT